MCSATNNLSVQDCGEDLRTSRGVGSVDIASDMDGFVYVLTVDLDGCFAWAVAGDSSRVPSITLV